VYRYKRLLVGLTMAERDEGTLRYAAMIARMAQSETVYFIHVAPSLDIPEEIREQYSDRLEPVDEATEDRIAEIVQGNFHGPSGTELIYDVFEGSPLTEILRLVRQKAIDLVLVGRTSERKDSRMVPEKLARKAPCSVLVIPQRSRAQVTRLLVPVDFSENSADAMEVAIAFAHATPLPSLVCFHAYWVPKVMHPASDDRDPGLGVLFKKCAERRYHDFITQFDLDGLSVSPMFRMNKNPASAIIGAIEELGSDLVIVGARGRTAAAAVLLGSVTERLITSAGVPVLAVKKKGEGLSLLEAMLLGT